MTEIQALPLFSTPVYVTDPDRDMPDILPQVKSLEYVRYSYSDLAHRTMDQQVLESFPEMAKWLERHINEYTHGMLGISSEHHRMKVTTSWVNKYNVGGSSYPHFHDNSMYSGNVFLSGNSGALVFERHKHSMMKPTIAIQNIYNSTQYKIAPRDSVLVLFPSNVVHFTEPTNVERYTLSFNMRVEGTPVWIEDQFTEEQDADLRMD